VHTALFTRAASASVTRAIFKLAPFNVVAALVIVLGGALGGTAQYGLWAGAVCFEWLSPVLRVNRGFQIAPAHFVERHGLVVLIAIGESVVAVGIGVSHLPVDGTLVFAALLGLALSACLWWLYFVGDPELAERAIAAMGPIRRARAALNAYGYAHLPILLGIVAIASAERAAFERPFHALSWARAAILAAGVAAYLMGDVLLRHELGIGGVEARLAAAVLALATAALGALACPAVQIGFLVLMLVAVAVVEPRIARGA
jgi:low temperature requirement protein LtrA